MNRKQKINLRKGIRAGVQILFLVLAPGLFVAAFSGIKNTFTQIGAGEALTMTPFLKMLILLCAFTILFGRFFCGYACPFGALGDLVSFISKFVQKKVKKKLPKIPDKAMSILRYVKYAVLAAILAMCVMGIYSDISSYSPWEPFSQIVALKFTKALEYKVGLAILVVLMIGMLFQERFFCQIFCPLGAIFSLLPVLPFSILKRDRESCINGCSACKRNCPVSLDIDGDSSRSGECFSCGKCTDICPKENIRTEIIGKTGFEWYSIAIKAILLLALQAVL